MKIADQFLRVRNKTNKRIEIISGDGDATTIPKEWRDSILGNCHILVVLPDIHMYVRDSNLDNFKYGCEAMLDFLGHLDKLKTELALRNKTLRVYQVGDIYEMRFPSVADPGSNITAPEIRMSSPDYDQIINMMTHLRTHSLYGNHDFELRHYPSFGLGANEGKVYLEHGFTPSPWYETPASPLWDPAMFMFEKLREVESFFSKLAVGLNLIGKDSHFAYGVTGGEQERGEYPSEIDYPAGLRDYYTKRIAADPDGKGTRACIIGHTHHPYLKLEQDAQGNGYIFADAGAWTEGRSDFVVMTNEQIAVCHYKRAQ